jgi:hypothetical protein
MGEQPLLAKDPAGLMRRPSTLCGRNRCHKFDSPIRGRQPTPICLNGPERTSILRYRPPKLPGSLLEQGDLICLSAVISDAMIGG